MQEECELEVLYQCKQNLGLNHGEFLCTNHFLKKTESNDCEILLLHIGNNKSSQKEKSS